MVEPDTKALTRPSMEGNQNAVSHGFYSHAKNDLQLRARSVRRLVVKAYQVCPWLTEQDAPTVRAWAEVVKLKAVAFNALEKAGIYRVEGGDIIGRRLLADYRQLAQTELSYAKELGFSPASRASMGLDIAKGKFIKERLGEHGN